MQVTIDSNEPLENALRVLGAMYEVTVIAAPSSSGRTQKSRASAGSVASAKPRRRATMSRTTTKRTAARTSQRRSTRRGREPVSNAELRAWARQHGYTVADRGRLPADVVEAFHTTRRR